MSSHPITDEAEASVDSPDKAYIGSIGRHSQFDAYADADSVAIRLVPARIGASEIADRPWCSRRAAPRRAL
jgi:hypothetical protein